MFRSFGKFVITLGLSFKYQTPLLITPFIYMVLSYSIPSIRSLLILTALWSQEDYPTSFTDQEAEAQKLQKKVGIF